MSSNTRRCTPSAPKIDNTALTTNSWTIASVDEAAARDAGHPNLPVPPTFFFCLEMDQPNPGALRELLGIDYRRILHGEQHFCFHAMAYAGDQLRFEPRIADIYDKKGGALEFVLRETRVSNQHGASVAEMKCLTVVRHG